MIEFERRFLIDPVCLDLIKQAAHQSERMSQGYVCADTTAIVRLRAIELNSGDLEWVVTVKKDTGVKGKHFEYESVVEDASELFDTLTQKISKRRYCVWLLDHLEIEVDVFENMNDLIIAEVELNDDEESMWLSDNIPSWFGREITGEKKYSNYSLCMNGLPND